jgi:hypothetical protein
MVATYSSCSHGGIQQKGSTMSKNHRLTGKDYSKTIKKWQKMAVLFFELLTAFFTLASAIRSFVSRCNLSRF